MDAADTPLKFPLTFGANATTSYIRQIPQTSSDPTAASLSLGFPPATGTPVAGGGTPPDIRDENGILAQLSAWAQWQSAGGPNYYDSVFSAAIGGYPAGAVLSAVGSIGAYWISTVDDNTTNPDALGAGWTRFNLIGLGTAAYKNTTNNAQSTVAAVSGAAVVGHIAVFTDVLGTIGDGGPIFTGGTAAQKAASDNTKPTVASVAGGTTSGNLAAFNDGNGTVKDSGYAATSFDLAGAAATAQSNAEAFATVAANNALSAAQTFATNADSIVLSSAKTYANAQATTAQNNAQSFATAAVAVETARAEAAEALLAPLNSPNFTNVPTAPTAAPGTNTQQLASTAFVQAAVGPAVRYARIAVSIGGSFALANFNWNTPFPSSCLCAVASCETNASFNPGANGNNFVAIVYTFNQNGGSVRIDTDQGGSPSGTVMVDIIGMGA